MAYANDIPITSTHTSTCAAKIYIYTTIPSHLHTQARDNLALKINNTALPMATHPKVLGLTLGPKLTFSTHIHNILVQAHKLLQMIKALTATGWGKHKETLLATYKAVMRPALVYACSIWSPLASSTSINKLQVMQNAALRTATGCTQDTNIQHIHTSIVSRHIATRGNNKILRTPPPHISSSEEIHPRLTCRTLAQRRTNKSSFLKSYLHRVDAKSQPSPLCPLCNTHTHDTHHLFNCTHIRTTLSPPDLWTDPAGVTALLARWTVKLAGGPQARTSNSPHKQGSWEWVDKNNRECSNYISAMVMFYF